MLSSNISQCVVDTTLIKIHPSISDFRNEGKSRSTDNNKKKIMALSFIFKLKISFNKV